MKMMGPEFIDDAVAILRQGGVVVYPTETSYGIGCDATNADAVARIFAMKGRPYAKGVTAILPAGSMGEEFGLIVPPALRALADTHWPGPLTIVLPVGTPSPIVPDYFIDGTFAVRRSSHPIANALVDALNVPLVSTSANISGEPELYTAQEIHDRFLQQDLQPDCIINAGSIPHRPPSTLVKLDDAGSVIVLRQGEIRID